jgi:hypothetical protein
MTRHDAPIDSTDLAELDQTFEAAVDENAPVPDGQYSVVVEAVELRRSRNSNMRMLEWKLRITGGPHAGRILWKNTLLEADFLPRAKSDLTRCGLVLNKLSDLPDRLNELLDAAIEVTVKAKGEFTEVYFRRGAYAPASSEKNGRPF